MYRFAALVGILRHAHVEGTTLEAPRLTRTHRWRGGHSRDDDGHGLRRFAPTPIQRADFEALSSLVGSQRWSRVGDFDGVRVSKQHIPGSDHVMMKAEAILNVSAQWALHCYATNDDRLIKSYNPQYAEGCDLEGGSAMRGKISWALSHNVGPVAARDFITRVRYVHLEDGSVACLSEGLHSHPKAPQPARRVIRGRIITAVQLVTPLPDDKCRFVSVCHCDPGGHIPSYLTNLLAKRDAPRYLLRLQQAAAAESRRHQQRGQSWPHERAGLRLVGQWGGEVKSSLREIVHLVRELVVRYLTQGIFLLQGAASHDVAAGAAALV